MGHSLDCILCLLQIASMAKKVNHACVMLQFCRNHVNCDHWSITVHPAIHQTCIATSWQKTNKSDIIWLYTFTHLFKMFKSFLTMPMHGLSSKYGIPRDHIMRSHLVEHLDSPGILHAPSFCIHSDQAIPHKDIQFLSALNDLFMRMPGLFKCN